MASLRVFRGPVTGVRIALEKQDTVLGRSPDCDVHIPLNSVSRRHAGISCQGDRFALRDLGSRHGTYLNHVRVSGLCPLRDGDRIRLAGFEAVFESSARPCPASDWQASSDPQLMIIWLEQAQTVSRRKLWLLVAASRRRFGGPEQRFGAELAERYAEDADRREIRVVELGDDFGMGAAVAWEAVAEAVTAPLNRSPALAGPDSSRGGADGESSPTFITGTAAVCHLLRCIFGNPFRAKPGIDPTWLRWNDGTVPRLAQSIYEGRRFEDMGVLHDALIDAGCNSDDMLLHAREQGSTHTRGCWLIDLLLGKE